jgi:hypothetical protein
MEPIRDPDLKEIDRELRNIDFVERASFGVELRARLREARARTPRRRHGAAVAVAALALALLPLTDSPLTTGEHPASLESGPALLIHDHGGSSRALYFAVSESGVVVDLETTPIPEQPSGTHFVTDDGARTAFVCMFEEAGSLCGPPDVLNYESGAPLGPLVYRDVCCRSAENDAARAGILTISGLRESVIFVFLYEDVNDDGRLSSGDRLRLRAHPSAPAIDEFPLPLFAMEDMGTRRATSGFGDFSAHEMAVFVY